ncbi:TonB C-terminal domain-containing protein [Thermodesulfovibrionales bacterium]|nr:TonB C-terminal domain-containing protein [Thermodesulfovibrionales bacterium]
MKTPGIYSACTYSLLLHILIVAIVVFTIERSNITPVTPVVYVVSLAGVPVMPTLCTSGEIKEIPDIEKSLLPPPEPPLPKEEIQRPRVAPRAKRPPKPVIKRDIERPFVAQEVEQLPKALSKKGLQEPCRVIPQEQPKKESYQQKSEDHDIVSERIAALQAVRKIGEVVALRKMVDIDGQRASVLDQEGQMPAIDDAYLKTHVPNNKDYHLIVRNKIREQWIFPGGIDMDLETIISIRIAKDGDVTINRVEKSSGVPLFDRSVLRAINMANPLPPPPQEMEIGVRFRP